MEGWHCCFHFTNEERILVGLRETEKGKNIYPRWKEEERLLEMKETMGNQTVHGELNLSDHKLCGRVLA